MNTDKKNMIRLKQQGYSYQAIGALYGLSRQRVHQIISGYQQIHDDLKERNGRYRQIHASVIKRDNNKCQKCGIDGNLLVHHIDGNDRNNRFANLITLCSNCHLALHRPNGKKNLTPGNAKINFLKRLSKVEDLKEGCTEILGAIKEGLNQ
jgi:5-methylcytosine-specific restriction endonuclease McrA